MTSDGTTWAPERRGTIKPTLTARPKRPRSVHWRVVSAMFRHCRAAFVFRMRNEKMPLPVDFPMILRAT